MFVSVPFTTIFAALPLGAFAPIWTLAMFLSLGTVNVIA